MILKYKGRNSKINFDEKKSLNTSFLSFDYWFYVVNFFLDIAINAVFAMLLDSFIFFLREIIFSFSFTETIAFFKWNNFYSRGNYVVPVDSLTEIQEEFSMR